MSSQYEETLQNAAKKRYREKLTVIGINECPYSYPDEEWVDDPTAWPELMYHHLYHYLIKTPRIYSPEAMENFKSLEAYKFFIDGWVQTIRHIKKSGVILMKADVRPSYKTTSKTHKPWVALSDFGSVLAGHCDCMAGLGETCSHVAALLYKVEAAVRIGMTKVAPTDQPCKWNQNFTKNITGAPAAKIDIYSEKAKSKISSTSTRREISVSLDDFNEFLNNLNENEPKIVGLSLFCDYQKNFVSVSELDTDREVTKLIPSLRSFYNEKNINLSLEEYEHLVDETIAVIKSYDSSQYTYVEEATRNQSQCIEWFRQRAGRITGSMFHKVCHTSTTSISQSLVSNICSDTPNSPNIPSLQWGRENEHRAIDLYINVHSNPEFVIGSIPLTDSVLHEDLDVQQIGFVISTEKPWYGASPDSVVFCTCCSYGTLEVKCPYNLRDRSLKEEIEKGNFYIYTDNSGKYRLKEDHPYYFQVQLQLYVTGTQYCDFFVWTPTEYLCIRIAPNYHKLEQMIVKCDFYWKNVILKELLLRSFENESKSNKPPKDLCDKCKTDDDEDTMQCMTCKKLFHPRCVGRKTLSKPDTWNCKKCSKTKKN